MEHKLRRWQLLGFLFTSAAGTLLHFLFEWSGELSLVGAVSAVNESVWEHMKLLFIPMFLFALAEASVLGDKFHSFWRAKLAGTLLGLLLIPTLYYTYTGALGWRKVFIDISIFYVAAAAAYLLEAFLLLREPQRLSVLEFPAMLLLVLLALVFLYFTYFPPRLPIFQDPTTLTYGINTK